MVNLIEYEWILPLFIYPPPPPIHVCIHAYWYCVCYHEYLSYHETYLHNLTEITFSDSMRKRHPIFHLVYFCYIRFDEQKTFHVKVLFTQYYYFFNTNLRKCVQWRLMARIRPNIKKYGVICFSLCK